METEGRAMVRSRYAPDRGLQARMGLTMFLLGLVIVAFGAALFGVLTATRSVSGGGIIAFPVLFALAIAGGSLFFSDKIALATAGARQVGPEDGPDARRLHAIVDRLCALADMPKPRVAIAPADMPNAFATGRNSKNAVVCATSGILRRLDDEELEGVLAHELSHVAHKDVVVMTVASFIGLMAALLIRFGFYSEIFGGGRGGGRGNNQSPVVLVALAMMVIGAVTYAISFLLIRLLSRYRELAADRSGALLTGQPSKLASALVKVSSEMGRIPTRDLRKAEPLSAFYFAPALKPGNASIHNVFSTHPSLERRLQQLSDISRQLGQ
jgi:heat shock protein HtpX